MKKTNVIFSFFAKRKALIQGSMLVSALFFIGISSAHAQTLNLKNATPLQVIQEELTTIQSGLATLTPGNPKIAHYAPYVAYLQAIIQKLSNGMSYHAAIATSKSLKPNWLTSVPGKPQSVSSRVGNEVPVNSAVSDNPKN